MDWLNHMFIPGVPLIEKILRPIIVYVFLVVGLRLAGKRELAQLSPFDLVVLLTISNTVQNAIIGEDNSVVGGIIGAITLLLANGALGRLVYRFRKLEDMVEGSTDILIQNGKLNKKVLDRGRRGGDHDANSDTDCFDAAVYHPRADPRGSQGVENLR